MAKARVTLTFTTEYEINTDLYPDTCKSFGDMLEMDLDNFEDDPFILIGMEGEYTISGDIFE